MDNVLDLVDHTFFRVERAAGVTNVIQCMWVYDRTPDIDGLRRFHRHLQQGRLARRIERSPLPFGRYRWVSPGDQPEIEVVETARPRAEFDAWCNEQSNIRLDAERGPGWHLAVLPFTEGGAGISLIASHCLTDAVGLCQALAAAAAGNDNAVEWPTAGSRGRWQALREDTRQTVRDLPAIRRAAVDAARFLRDNGGAGGPAPTPTVTVDEEITFPAATFFVDAGEWDARARALGGTANGLYVALAARLAQRVGRVGADGSVAVTMAINERTDGDTRANAIKNVDFTIDPTPATTELRGIRAATKQALVRSQHEPDARWTLLPLVPLVPERLGKQWLGAATNSAATVGSSNIGAVDPATNRPDGTDADHFAIRSLSARMTTGMLHQLGGLLSLLSGRVNGRVFVSVVAYAPTGVNSNSALRQHLSSVLDEFSLASTMGWPCDEPALGR
ncbi:MAG: hypothetical protein JOZ00_13105 [Mycobacterium sp.]|uniref:hypothetical protein n=1 Tax=Mycobacterium sp. TaxID=1785 RepID=UPI001ED3C55D|nr:hypothetical protein [Mycobacterium sp.]MBV8787611.1 hypothetical protein [Mycobacterium sp.]